MGTAGNGLTSNTYFSAGESQGAGACGGCGATKAQGGVGCVKKGFDQMVLDLLAIPPSDACPADKCVWLGTAPAESMASPYCSAANFDCGLGLDARGDPNTASAPCGSSFKLEMGNGKWANIVVVDACPHNNNTKWCPAKKGETNPEAGSHNHFDLWVGASQDAVASRLGLSSVDEITTKNKAGLRRFTPIRTPPEVTRVLQQYCCNSWYYGQGCPTICGSSTFQYKNS